MKILFLDFDGVLNDYYPNNKIWHTDNPDLENFSKTRKSVENFIYNMVEKHYEVKSETPKLCNIVDLDVDKIVHLNRIVKETGCKIVFSTSWRRDGIENLALYLTLKGFNYPNDCISRTTQIKGIRGLEIKEWLDIHEDVESFAILDDESFDIDDYYKDEFIKVKGLTETDANAIIDLLNKGD